MEKEWKEEGKGKTKHLVRRAGLEPANSYETGFLTETRATQP